MDVKKALEKVVETVLNTFFVGLFDEAGLLVDSLSKLEGLDPEVATAVSQDIIRAIRKGIETRSKTAYGDFEEAILETENAHIVILSFKEAPFGMVGFFDKSTPIGLIKTSMEKAKDLIVAL